MLEVHRAVSALAANKGLLVLTHASVRSELEHRVTLQPMPGLQGGLRAAVHEVWLGILDDAASRDGLRRQYTNYRKDGTLEVTYSAISDENTEKPTNQSVFRF